MNKSEQETLQFVLGKLAERMVTTRRLKERFNPEVPKQASPEQPGVVFVLGAGCSMQYGLPSFVHLLRHSYDDLQPRGPKRDKAWGLDSLRDRLDPHWRTSKPQELRDLLDWYLNRIHGSQCTGYLRLARMVRNGYVTAIVNMNFDLLLKQALSTTCDPKQYVFSRTFDPKDNVGILNEAVVFTPHGSMQDGQGVPILDLASSDLFDTKDETEAAERLFRQNDIVFLGYSGADAKIAAALTPAKVPTDKEEKDPQDYNQIFVLNVTTPDPRLLRIMVARRSTDLAVTGYAAAFENVMEELDQALEQYWNMPQDFADRL
ncbi:MAG TPA: hypothetical protein VJG13_11935, partial [Thermoanaerobaculia bacterium]|nr:hypothetical protein [Thermoanaerobaculia bacterium]